MDVFNVVDAGGWDRRFAVVLAEDRSDHLAAYLIDTNGDGVEVAFGLSRQSASGQWEEIFGEDDVSTASTVTAANGFVYGWGEGMPGQEHVVENDQRAFVVPVSTRGYWVFARYDD